MDNLIYVLIGLIVLLVGILIFFIVQNGGSSRQKELIREIDRNQKEQREFNNQIVQQIADLKANMSEGLLGFNHSLTEDFNSLSERTIFKLSNLEKNLNDNIQEAYKLNSDTFQHIQERLTRIDSAQKNIEELSKDISSLESILTDKKNRGTFGEIELYSLLENAMGINPQLWDRQVHFENGTIADAVIYGNNAMKCICIDSKFPLENYRRIYDEKMDKEERNKAAKQFKADVVKHINDIHDKYIIEETTSDFAYMFIPSEAVFAEINANYPEVIEYSYSKKVYIVSPTTLMAYLTAIRSIYLGVKRDEKARAILVELNHLSEDFRRLKERSDKMAKAQEDYNNGFEQFRISVDKILKRFENISRGDFNEDE